MAPETDSSGRAGVVVLSILVLLAVILVVVQQMESIAGGDRLDYSEGGDLVDNKAATLFDGEQGPHSLEPPPTHSRQEVALDEEPTADEASVETGFVRFPDDEPAAGAAVYLFCVSDLVHTLTLVADSKGSFSLDGGHPGHRYRIQAELSGWASAETHHVVGEIESGPVLFLGVGGSIEGAVYDSAGRPLSEFSVSVFRIPEESFESAVDFIVRLAGPKTGVAQGPFEFRDRSEGTFRVDGLRSGPSMLMVQTKESTFRWSESVAVIPGRVVGPVSIQVPRTTALAGQVVDGESGQPVEGAIVSVIQAPGLEKHEGSRSATTDSSGRFELESVAEIETVAVEAIGYALSENPAFTLRGGASNGLILIELNRSSNLHVSVFNESGNGIPGERIAAQVGSRVTSTRTSVDGAAVLENLSDGDTALVFWMRRDGSFAIREAALTSGEDVFLEFRHYEPESEAGIFGAALLPDGPLVSGFVTYTPSGAAKPIAAESLGPRGEFALGPLSPGEGKITLRVGEFLVDNDHEFSWTVDISSSGVRKDLQLPGGILEGRILSELPDERVVPIPNVQIRLRRIPVFSEDGEGRTAKMSARAQTDEAGAFKAVALAGGFYEVSMLHPHFEEQVLHLQLGDDVPIHLGELFLIPNRPLESNGDE